MKYLTGIHALNLVCELDTPGDWHCSALAWKSLTIRESDSSIYGEYGLEFNKNIPEHQETYVVANHIRALLDLLSEGNFSTAQGMRDDFICNDNYTIEIFEQVVKLKKLPHWNEIDRFMRKEYYTKWLNFKEEVS